MTAFHLAGPACRVGRANPAREGMTMSRIVLLSMLLLTCAAAPACCQPVLKVDAPPALAAWTSVEFAAFTRATGIRIATVASLSGADLLIAPTPLPQRCEHEKLTFPYISHHTAAVPDALKDDDGDWTAIALTDLAFTPSKLPRDRTAEDALRLLLIHAAGATPPGSPALLMTLAPGGSAAISFAVTAAGDRDTIVIPYFVARLKAGSDPGDAARLIDFLLGKPAQAALPALAWALPARGDVLCAGDHAAVLDKYLHGVAIYVPDWHRARKTLTG